MNEDLNSLHGRLNYALMLGEEGRTMDQRVEALHDHCREVGVRGIHSTRMTLRRWVGGDGNPPPYWLEIAAAYLGVTVRWLTTGEGVMFSKGGRIVRLTDEPGNKAKARKQPEAGATKPAPQPPPKRTEAKAKPVQPAEKPPEAEEPIIAIPSAADVHAASAPDIVSFVSQSEHLEVVEAVLKHEPNHPKFGAKGGRATVMRAATARLEELKEA